MRCRLFANPPADSAFGHEYHIHHQSPIRARLTKVAIAKTTENLSLNNLARRLETHVKENPMKAVGQAVAAGYILRFCPSGYVEHGAAPGSPAYVASRLWQGKSLLPQGPKSEEK
jgi:hypothetical protein